MKLRDQVAWLAFHAYEADRVTEGDLVEALGLVGVSVREQLDAGRALGEALHDGRVARAEAHRARVQAREGDAETVAHVAGAQLRNFVGEGLALLFADGRTRTTGEVAAALKINADTASQRLRRSTVVVRVRHGLWKLRGAS